MGCHRLLLFDNGDGSRLELASRAPELMNQENLQKVFTAAQELPPLTGWKLELAEAVAKEAQDSLNVFSELAELLASHNRRP